MLWEKKAILSENTYAASLVILTMSRSFYACRYLSYLPYRNVQRDGGISQHY